MSLIPAVARSNSSIIIPNNDNIDDQQQQQDNNNNMVVPINDDYYPTPYDILLGKEKAIFNHSGNKRFRAIINSQIKAYIDAPTKSAKTKLIHQIHNDIRKSGYRFLKKREDDSSNLWDEVDRQGAREKVSHALRDRVKGLVKSTRKRHGESNIVNVSNSVIRKILREELGSNNNSKSSHNNQDQNITEAGAMSILFQMNNNEPSSENRLLPRPVTSDTNATNVYDSFHKSNNEDHLSFFPKNIKKRRLSLLDTVAARANLISNNNQNSFSAASIFGESLLSPSSIVDSSSSTRENYSKKRRLSVLGIGNMFVPVKASRRNGLKLGGGVRGGVEQLLAMGNNNGNGSTSRMLLPDNDKKMNAPKRRLSLLCLQQHNLTDNLFDDNNDNNKKSNNNEFDLSPFSIEETIQRFNNVDNNAIDNEIITWNLSQRSRRRLSMLGFLEEEEQKEDDEGKDENNLNDSLESSANKSSWRPVSMFGLFQTDDDKDAKNSMSSNEDTTDVDDDENENKSNDIQQPKERIEVIFSGKQSNKKFRRRRSSMSTLFFGDDQNIENNDHQPLDNSIELNDDYLDDLFSCGNNQQQQ